MPSRRATGRGFILTRVGRRAQITLRHKGLNVRFTNVMAVLLVVVLGHGRALAGPGTDAVRKTNETIRMLLAQEVEPGSDEANLLRTQIAHEISLLLDTDAVGRQAVQDHLGTLTKKQLEEFQDLLGALIAQSYTAAVQSQVRYEVDYLDESGEDNRVVVTEVRTMRRGRPYHFTITYRLHKRDGAWRAYDVVTDGASLVRNYRSQFNRIIAKEGYQGLLARMQKRYQKFQRRDPRWARRATAGNESR